jgi:hypothetical protein
MGYSSAAVKSKVNVRSRGRNARRPSPTGLIASPGCAGTRGGEGGKDNFAADRAVAEQVAGAYPDVLVAVRAQRAFLARAVHFLVTEAGIRQFLDIGTGLPSANNTHQVAQRAAPTSRVVYVDNDPIVLGHARALLSSSPEGATAAGRGPPVLRGRP